MNTKHTISFAGLEPYAVRLKRDDRAFPWYGCRLTAVYLATSERMPRRELVIVNWHPSLPITSSRLVPSSEAVHYLFAPTSMCPVVPYQLSSPGNGSTGLLSLPLTTYTAGSAFMKKTLHLIGGIDTSFCEVCGCIRGCISVITGMLLVYSLQKFNWEVCS